ncbi:MAG: rhodanese-like domain-containing protein [Candidatus Thioglobus sp.]|nr:MAG: rhodanese-like domain-containing protein [Candidatus Thioglobus sp.]RUM80408.1 MAG: rhodanese-like domain-containing protein [Candidatus Thioglobus sp.]
MKTKLLLLAVVSTFAVGAQATSCGPDWNFNTPCNDANMAAAKLAAEISASKPVGIVSGVLEVAGISRNANNSNLVDPGFAKTSRPCPPFCIQPTEPFAPAAVETVTELDVIHAARDSAGGDASILVVDARTPGWVAKGTIPHSVNVPFTKLNSKALAKDPMAVVDILTGTFGVVDMDGVLNYDNAKTLYLFCNGAWCGQSPASINALLTMGYPQSKIKYYRGGMNDWKLLGLTTK